MSLGRGIAGILVVIAIAYLFSYDRKRIDWKLVGGGLLIQLVLALSILYIPIVGSLFKSLGIIFVKLMDFTSAGLDYPESSRRVVVVTAEGNEYIRYRRFGCLW